MNRIVLDQSAASQLAVSFSAHEQCELIDPLGQTLGYFIPAARTGESDADVYAWARMQVSDEELDRLSKEPLGRTTAEILAHLEKLAENGL